MHHGTYVTHVLWFMPGSLARGDREYAPGIPGARTTRNFKYLARGPWVDHNKTQQMHIILGMYLCYFIDVIIHVIYLIMIRQFPIHSLLDF